MIRLYAYAAIGAAVLALAGGIYIKGRHDTRQAEQLRQSEQYRETRERIDDAIENSRADGADWIGRLRRITE